MSTLYARDEAAIAGIEKLRFFFRWKWSRAAAAHWSPPTGRSCSTSPRPGPHLGLRHGHPGCRRGRQPGDPQRARGRRALGPYTPIRWGWPKTCWLLFPDRVTAGSTSAMPVPTPTTSRCAPAVMPPDGAPCWRSSTAITAASVSRWACPEYTSTPASHRTPTRFSCRTPTSFRPSADLLWYRRAQRTHDKLQPSISIKIWPRAVAAHHRETRSKPGDRGPRQGKGGYWIVKIRVPAASRAILDHDLALASQRYPPWLRKSTGRLAYIVSTYDAMQ